MSPLSRSAGAPPRSGTAQCPERIWEATTDPVQRAQYNVGSRPGRTWATGSTYTAGVPGVVDIAEGENLVIEPSRLLTAPGSLRYGDG